MVKGKPGPGPGAYMLHPLTGYDNHDVAKYRNPQYTMRPKTGFINKHVVPGPKYDTTHMNMHGKESPPAYTLASRYKPLSQAPTPSAATYRVELVPRMKEKRPPAYTLSDRYKPLSMPNFPGPDKYLLPSTIGPKVPDKIASAAYTMISKHGLSDKPRSPGPARYDAVKVNAYKNRLPIYTMSIKSGGDRYHTIGPGPSAYLPKCVTCGLRGYSFGLKTDASPYITPDDEMPCINK